MPNTNWGEEFLKGIGQLRQWLNEERITDNNKLVTTEDLLKWFKQ